jgi:ketosteroid isomerase-like protein
MTSELNDFRDRYHQSVAAFIRGDPSIQKDLWSRGPDVTLANPLGPPARGPEQVFAVMDDAAGRITEGESYDFHTVSCVETADLAYEVGVERSLARLGDAPDKVRLELRVTAVFRREAEGWKLVHRHADTVTSPRPVESLVLSPEGSP